MKIGVCIRAKNEQKIICDWVNHYLKLGFDKIFIYDNMSTPSIEHTLKNNIFESHLLNHEVIIKIDNTTYSNQVVVYQECIQENKDLDWLLLCDADEFIWLKEGNMKDFLSNFTNDTCTIFVNWLVYGTSNLKMYDVNQSVFSQFIMREEYNHFWNRFVKSFVRPNLMGEHSIRNVHKTYNDNYKLCDVYQNIIIDENLHKCAYYDKMLNDNTPLVLVHYMTLDFESMLEKRTKNLKQQLGFGKKDNKYTLEWYNSPKYGFKDTVKDLRMLQYS